MSKVRPPIRKVDANQKELVHQLRQVGASVLSIASIGRGACDLVIGFRGENYLLEVKAGNGRLTRAESAFFSEWRGQKALVHNFDEALAVLLGGNLPFTDMPGKVDYIKSFKDEVIPQHCS